MEEMDFIFGRDKSNDNEEEETEEIKETEEPLTEEELEVLQKAGLRD
jgi:predicted DNA binding protein